MRKGRTSLFGGWKTLFILLVVLLAMARAQVAMAQDSSIDPDVADAVKAAAGKLTEAYTAEDADALGEVTDDNFVWINNAGEQVGREEWLTFPPGQDIKSIEISKDQYTQLAPDVVLMTALDSISGEYLGTPWSETNLDTLTWVNRDGSWKVASLQQTSSLSDEERTQLLIDSAKSAAPPLVAEGATVGYPNEDGSLNVIKEGDNGYLCFPDDPNTDANDPSCLDGEGAKLIDAWLSGGTPAYDGPGVIYALQQTQFASTTDPTVMAPPEGKDWTYLGPAVFMVSPDGFDEDTFSTDPASGGPYIMWSGTPDEFLVIPVGGAPAPDAEAEDAATSN